MPREPTPAKPRKQAPPRKVPKAATPRTARPVAKVAVPLADRPRQALAATTAKRVDEPVWLVRAVLLLFLIGFAAFLAREVYSFVQALG
jgi:hypothetical protein